MGTDQQLDDHVISADSHVADVVWGLGDAQRAALSLMREKALKRRDRFETYAVKVMPDKRDIGSLHIPGVYSIVDLKKRRRYVLEGALVHLGNEVRESPTTAARDYLTTGGFKAARLRGGSKDRLWERMNITPALPFFAQPFHGDEGYYVDIKKCFYALMHIGGWGVSYDPGRFLLKGRTPSDFPLGANGVSRNSMVSCSASRQMYALAPPDWQSVHLNHFNAILNTSLNVWIRDVLHCIASRAIELGAVYVMTDGYICPTHACAQNVRGMIEDYGLSVAVKGRGLTDVAGVGVYRAGSHKSKNYGRVTAISQTVAGVRKVSERSWLERSMSSLAAMDGALHLVSDII